MAGLLARLLRRPPAQEKSGAGYPLYFGEGTIGGGWDWGWWQQGRDPLKGAGTAIVHACVDAYAQTIASVPAQHWRYNEDGTREKITTSAASRLVRMPNAYQTRSDFYLNLVKQLLLEGNAYAVGFRNDRNEFSELHLLRARATQPYIDPETKEVFYTAGDNPLIQSFSDLNYMIPARDVLHIRLYTPQHPLVGVSPITNAVASIAANSAISQQQATFFNNMSRPSGVLSTDMKLTKDQMMQLRAAWEEQSKNMNTGGIPILGSGLKWEPMSITTQDSQAVQAFNMTVEDIARAFRVPLPLVNDNRNATYNNVEQLISHWLSGGLGFVLDHVENNLDKFFGLDNAATRIEFDTDVLMRTDFSGRIEGYSKGIQNGLFTVNEARARFNGLPSVEHGDAPIVQAQMVPLGWNEQQQAETGSAAPPGPPSPPELDEEEQRGAAVYYLKRALNDG